MPVGGDDDTLASSSPTTVDGAPLLGDSELVAGRYRIVRWLGGGGMGRVYEAHDTELDERVALKVLRTGLSKDALERFKREVKLTRRIQHRNVARMFDLGEHKGERFLTMELVDGEPLTRLVSATPMPWARLSPLGAQICEGLAAAHAAGVIHRDLKPDNVLVERGTERAVITDFGIARGGDDPSVTQVGAVVGTPRYMAPEQLAGRDVDARADLFSVGVMLFELATGTRPWAGDNAIAIAVSQATTPPRTLDSAEVAVPAYFAQIVAACLRLDPTDRPGSAAAVARALAEQNASFALGTDAATRLDTPVTSAGGPERARRASAQVAREPAAPTLAEPTAIAVLPVACSATDAYLADGLRDDLTDTLSTTPGLRVRPAGALGAPGGEDPRALGQRLGVDHVVSATLRRTPAGLRIATRLIGVADGFQIWAHKTDCSEAEVLEVADELARGIATALSSRATSPTRPTDPRAVDLYLRARAELRRFWGSHAQAAADLLEKAVEYAPTSPPILGAFAYASVQAWVMRADAELLPKAEAALKRGLASGHGEAYLASAQLRFNCNAPEAAAADLGRALVRAPMSAPIHELAGKILLEVEGPGPARQHYETARGLDPGRTRIIDADLARIDALERRWDDSERRLAGLIEDADISLSQLGYIGRLRLSSWRRDRSFVLAAAEANATRVSAPVSQLFAMLRYIQRHGQIDRERFDEATLPVPGPGVPHRQILVRMQVLCELALLLDDQPIALDGLERVVDAGLIDVTWLDGCPLLEDVLEHPRVKRLRRIVGDRAARVLAAFRGVTTAT